MSPNEEYQNLKERLILTFEEQDRLKKIAIKAYKKSHNIKNRINICDLEKLIGAEF